MKVAALLLGVMFVVFAALQYNDPDPTRWIAMYLAAAAASFQHQRWDRSWLPSAVVGAVAIAWSIYTLSALDRMIEVSDLFASMQAKDGTVEIAREGLGLMIVALWMLALVLTSRYDSSTTQSRRS